MKENNVLRFFYEISAIPRKSGREKQIADYIEKFAKNNKFRFYRDKNNNMIIIKEASKGYENEESIILQCHTDMICEKLEKSRHDFNKDGLELYIDGDLIKAKDTTLGADNGIGVAIILSILDSNNLNHPKIEAIFTVQEETTMLGAQVIDTKYIEGNRMICLDNMSENELWIGSAEAIIFEDKLKGLEKIKVVNDKIKIRLSLGGFKGGHSGQDIGKNRGNPIKILAQILNYLKGKIEINIDNFNGGSKVNVIPREVSSDIYVDKNKFNELKEEIERIKSKIKESTIDGAKNIEINYKEKKELTEQYCFDIKSTNKILDLINEIPNGVYYKDKYNNPQLSLNIGIIKTEENTIEILFSVRSNIKEQLKKLLSELTQIREKYNIEENKSYLPGYEHEQRSEFINICKKIYENNFKRKPKLINVHACLEASFFNLKIKDLDYIAIAPNIYNAHSPKECCSITSINRVYEYIINILKYRNKIK